LDDQEEADTCAKVGRLAIKTSKDEDTGLTEGQDDSKELLSCLIKLSVGFEVKVDIDQVCTGQKLR